MKPDAIRTLIETMNTLRGENGCPWDKEQDHRSLREFLLEEAYEVLACIDRDDSAALREELGDLLLQIVFHAQIARENGQFDIDDVAKSINDKLVRRHPNVFGSEKITTAEEQSRNWERIKIQEGSSSVIGGVPNELPALLRAHRIQQKVAGVGFDWPTIDEVWTKLQEEMAELQEARSGKNQAGIEEELGDVLFTLVNLARFLRISAEDALRTTIDKFNRRFQQMESQLQTQGKQIADCSLAEMDEIWDAIKRAEKNRTD